MHLGPSRRKYPFLASQSSKPEFLEGYWLTLRTKIYINLLKEAQNIVVAVSDCEKNSGKVSKPHNKYLNFEIEMLTDDAHHFEAGQEKHLVMHCVLVLIFGLLYIPLLRRYLREQKKSEYDRNPLFMGIHFCVVLKIAGALLETLNLIVYSYRGREIPGVNILGSSGSYIANFLLSCYLIFVAHGWTIDFQDLDEMTYFKQTALIVGTFKFMLISKTLRVSKSPR